ncbi:GNAT superfamily N-acetyltransferase [Microbacterium paludicola]|uniref:GNAT superfamily N-acetyltransferase n=1 Tax=Microbacterium paludicola TaxID=300019 RepID=A0ABU1I4M7_9MICO|nr:GNAT superfamily N-acetyltransferase [Microbacterium paludicola]
MTITTPPALGVSDVRDNAAWHSLTGVHAHLAIGDDLVRRYPDDVAGFVGVRTWDDPAVWDSLATVVGSGNEFSISTPDRADAAGVAASAPELPEGWVRTFGGAGVQLVETDRLRPRPDDEAVELGEADVADMLALVERNRPGPFRPRTYLLGRYIGIRRDGRLIAMAGERLQPGEWTEISAVATDEAYRRQGLGVSAGAGCRFPHPAAGRPRDDARRGVERECDRRVREARIRAAAADELHRRASSLTRAFAARFSSGDSSPGGAL